MRSLHALAAWILLGTLAGPHALSAQMPGDDPVTITVQNERDEQLTVFMEHAWPSGATTDSRIGTVSPMNTETLVVPDWIADTPEANMTLFIYVEGQGDLQPVQLARSAGDDLGIIVTEQDDLMETIRTPTVDPGQASVTVMNNRDETVMVLVADASGEWDSPVHLWIGTAPPDSETTLPLPPFLVTEDDQELQFILHPAGGEDLPTQAVQVERERNIEILVPE